MGSGYTADSFFNGKLQIRQMQDGYRFSIDAVLLANFCQVRSEDRILDIGTGCGIIPLLLARQHPGISLVGVEVQPELAELALFNVRQNKMEGRIAIVHQDIKDFRPRAAPQDVFDGIVSNPPYRRASSGRVNPNHQKALARHEILLTLDGLLKKVRALLKTAGWFALIYPAERVAELFEAMRRVNIEPKRLRPVYSTVESPARLVLVGGVKAGRPGLIVEPPLVIYGVDGRYTGEVAAMMSAPDGSPVTGGG